MIHYPCIIDGQYFENTRIAHRALFLRDGRVSYDRLQRALKSGMRELYGRRIERVTPRLVIALPLRPGDDGADLVLQFPAVRQKEHKLGEPLLRYPVGEDPLSRGLSHWN
jgi:hypothetical protein